MLEIKVNNNAKGINNVKIEIRTKGTADVLLAELTVVISSLQRHNPRVFSKETILRCVDLAEKIKTDDEF